MKRCIAVLCICLICSLCVANPSLLTVQAAQTEITVDDFTYIINDAGASLKAYNGSASDVTVPVTVPYEGMNYKIRKVEANAFDGNKYLETLVIPKEITQVGNCAFKNCVNLKKVTINGDLADCDFRSYGDDNSGDPNYQSKNKSVFYNAGSNQDTMEVIFGEGVTRIPAHLFSTGNSKDKGTYAHVTSLVIPETVTEIGDYAFNRCYDLKDIIWGGGLISIGSHTFANTGLTDLQLPEKVQTIGEGAFQYCEALENITLPESVANVGYAAFEGNTALQQLTLEGDTILGNIAFKDCINLAKITINGDLADCDFRSSGLNNSADPNYQSRNVSVFFNAGSNQNMMEVIFGEGVTKIPAHLFSTGSYKEEGTYAHVTSVTIPDTVTSVGAKAFYHCYDLKNVVWGKELSSIGESAFAYASLEQAEFPSKLAEIGESAFYGNNLLRNVFIPASVKSIGKDAFAACAESFSIKCYMNSAAAAYAQENGIPFDALVPEYIYGDMDGDTAITSADALIMLKIAAKLQTADDVQNLAGDVDNSGDITAGDALLVLQKAAKLIPAFPVETML